MPVVRVPVPCVAPVFQKAKRALLARRAPDRLVVDDSGQLELNGAPDEDCVQKLAWRLGLEVRFATCASGPESPRRAAL